MQPARVLVDPVDGVPYAVETKRWGVPLVILMASVAAAAVAWFIRWDATQSITTQLAMSGELLRTSEVEIAEQVAQAERLALVAGVAKAIFVMPVMVLLLAVAVKLTGWFIGRPAPFPKAFTAASVALLPIALYYLVFSAAVLYQHGVAEAMRTTLIPSNLAQLLEPKSEGLGRALGAIDLFNLWSAVLLGLGIGEATGIKKWKGVALGLLLYAMYAAVFMIGIPGMQGGPGMGGGRG